MSSLAVILLAGDSEEGLLPMRRFFQKLYSQNPIFATKGGEEAIAYLSGEGKYANREEYPMPDVMLVNLKKPPVDGFALVEWIRQQPGLGAIEVIVLTQAEKLSDFTGVALAEELNRADFS